MTKILPLSAAVLARRLTELELVLQTQATLLQDFGPTDSIVEDYIVAARDLGIDVNDYGMIQHELTGSGCMIGTDSNGVELYFKSDWIEDAQVYSFYIKRPIDAIPQQVSL